MSQELADACDSLLQYTSILQHSSDIPRIVSKSGKLNKTKVLQEQYYDLYKQLNSKISRLLYLNKLKQSRTQEIPSEELSNIKEQFDIQDNEELFTFLLHQNTDIKINKLFERYILLVQPILKSIHYSNLTESDNKILQDLQKLYDLQSGISLRVLHKENEDDLYFDKIQELQELITDQIGPILVESNDINSQLEQLNKKYVKFKEETVDENSSRIKIHELVEKWDKLKKLTCLIPLLISSLPLDWYSEESLTKIMQECDVISSKINKLTSILNKDNVGYYSTKSLYALEFEIEIEN